MIVSFKKNKDAQPHATAFENAMYDSTQIVAEDIDDVSGDASGYMDVPADGATRYMDIDPSFDDKDEDV